MIAATDASSLFRPPIAESKATVPATSGVNMPGEYPLLSTSPLSSAGRNRIYPEGVQPSPRSSLGTCIFVLFAGAIILAAGIFLGLLIFNQLDDDKDVTTIRPTTTTRKTTTAPQKPTVKETTRKTLSKKPTTKPSTTTKRSTTKPSTTTKRSTTTTTTKPINGTTTTTTAVLAKEENDLKNQLPNPNPTPNNAVIRLVSADGRFDQPFGHVQVRRRSVWYSVCEAGWGLTPAKLTCYILGYTGPTVSAYIADGTAVWKRNLLSGSRWLQIRSCTGSESQLTDCDHLWKDNYNSSSGCNIGALASVVCHGLPDGVRLVGSDDKSLGIVEVHYAGEWRRICDSSWDVRDATVVCRMLGKNTSSARALAESKFDIGAGQKLFWMSDVACTGTETNIGNCSHPGWGMTQCFHQASAAVSCTHDVFSANIKEPADMNDKEDVWPNKKNESVLGVVEISYRGNAGTVCSTSTANHHQNANVVCKSKGYRRGLDLSVSNGVGAFATAAGEPVVEDLACSGTEMNISECPRTRLGDPFDKSKCVNRLAVLCGSEPVAVTLTSSKPGNALRGKAAITVDGYSYNVCGEMASSVDKANIAPVLCNSANKTRSPGFTRLIGIIEQNVTEADEASTKAISSIGCSDGVDDISKCSLSWKYLSDCQQKQLAVHCNTYVEVVPKVVTVNSAHLVVVRLPNVTADDYSSVCGHGWTDREAAVVCRDLNLAVAGTPSRGFQVRLTPGVEATPGIIDYVKCDREYGDRFENCKFVLEAKVCETYAGVACA